MHEGQYAIVVDAIYYTIPPGTVGRVFRSDIFPGDWKFFPLIPAVLGSYLVRLDEIRPATDAEIVEARLK